MTRTWADVLQEREEIREEHEAWKKRLIEEAEEPQDRYSLLMREIEEHEERRR